MIDPLKGGVEAAGVAIMSAVGAGGTAFLASTDAIDSGTALVGLATYGPLGAIVLFLLWRTRERDREIVDAFETKDALHREERRMDAEANRQVLRDLFQEARKENEVLARIEAILKERK